MIKPITPQFLQERISSTSPWNRPVEFKNESFIEKSLKQIDAKRSKIEKAVLKYGGVPFLLFLALGFIFQSEVFLMLGGFFFVFLLIGFLIANNLTNSTSLISGLQGENNVRAILRRTLSSDYSIFYNYPTPYGDIDALFIGPCGVYVLEIKNHNGYVTINGDNWERFKVGRAGTIYKAEIGSPSLQVKRNAIYVRDLLRKNGLNIWVQAVVVLTNPDVKVKIVKPPENVIITGLKGLKVIVNNNVKQLSAEVVERAKKVMV